MLSIKQAPMFNEYGGLLRRGTYPETSKLIDYAMFIDTRLDIAMASRLTRDYYDTPYFYRYSLKVS